MKKTIFALFFLMSLGLSFLSAQILVREEVIPMSMGDHNGLTIVLADINASVVETSWIDFMKENGKTEKRKGELATKKIAIVTLDESGSMNVFGKAKQTGDDVELSVWFDLGGTYLSSSLEPEKYAAAEELLRGFAVKASIDSAMAKLTVAQSALKEMASKMNKLQARYRGYKNDIKKAENSIAKARKKMRDNLDQQQKLQEETKSLVLSLQKAEESLKNIKQ